MKVSKNIILIGKMTSKDYKNRDCLYHGKKERS